VPTPHRGARGTRELEDHRRSLSGPLWTATEELPLTTRSPTRPGESIGTAVLGAGPAGLTAAYVLGRRNQPAVVFEGSGTVGGISRTVEWDGYRFDLGGHRFFTKLTPIARMWEDILGDEFLTRPRLSRIYYKGNFLAYPLVAKDVVARLGVVESARCALSYAAALIRPRRDEPETFEEWVTARFGKRLYNAFFRSYTEKVWGIPGSEIRSEWAAQRIKDFSLLMAILAVLRIRRAKATTLIEEFRYPRLGPGQMWERVRDRVEETGIPVELRSRCVALRHTDGRVESVVIRHEDGEREHQVDAVLSSIPLSELVLTLEPAAPPAVADAARRLRYRSMCLVALMTTEPQPFPDNWIYLHDPDVRAGRVQNFGAWSEDMVRPGTTCLGVEYFCFEGDDIWTMSNDDAVAMATAELGRIGLLDPDRVTGGVKVLVPKAYPMYDADYASSLEVIRPYVESFANLATFGRNGLHRYNNQDHSMWTAVLATLNQLDGTAHDVWSVNTEAEYHEEGEAVDCALGRVLLDQDDELATIRS
jgi:protoporphyrinogen oxidase